jgi:hypothetical protein
MPIEKASIKPSEFEPADMSSLGFSSRFRKRDNRAILDLEQSSFLYLKLNRQNNFTLKK